MTLSYADFGPLVIEQDVDDAVVATVQKWLPLYITQFEFERGIPSQKLPRPKQGSISATLDESELSDSMLPAVLIQTPETTDIWKTGDGVFSATFTVMVRSIARGTTPPTTRRNVSQLGGCVRRVIMQQQSLGGFASEISWEGARLRPIAGDSRNGRYRGVQDQTFSVQADGLLELSGPRGDPDGPFPPTDPGDGDQLPGDLPEVQDIDITVIGVPITATLGDD